MSTVDRKTQRRKLDLAQDILGYRFKNETYILSAITHPSAVEGKPVKYSYERLEFLGDSILGALVADAAFHRFPEIDEGGLTRIKVSLVSGQSLSRVADDLGFADFIIFGQSERGTGRRGLHSALENVYEAVVAALFLDGGLESAKAFVADTLLEYMDLDMASEPENPKSMLQERLQEDGITPTYKLIETQGPPHDRTFITQVYAGPKALGSGVGRTKKESESQAARSALDQMEPDRAQEKHDRERTSEEKAGPHAVRKADVPRGRPEGRTAEKADGPAGASASSALPEG